jgi:elongation factor P hydroxylase
MGGSELNGEWRARRAILDFGFWILDFGWCNVCWDGISAIDLPNPPFNIGIIFGGDRPLAIPAIAATVYNFIVFGTAGFMHQNQGMANHLGKKR